MPGWLWLADRIPTTSTQKIQKHQIFEPGVDPRTLSRTESFHGSHRSALKALLAGACDVARTCAGADADGTKGLGNRNACVGVLCRIA